MDFSRFFAPEADIPAGEGFPMYGAAHLCWLAVVAAACVFACRRYRGLDAPRRRRMLRTMAVVTPTMEAIRMLILAANGSDLTQYLPLHLCGLAILAELISAFWPGWIVRELCYCIALPGAASALLFPNWTNVPALHFISLFGFVQHGLLVTVACMLLTSGELRPSARRLPACLGVVAAAAVPVHRANLALGTNYMFLEWPSPGSPLVLLADIPGRYGYLTGMLLLLLTVWAFMYGIPALAGRRKNAAGRYASARGDSFKKRRNFP